MRSNAKRIIRRIYDEVHAALWALLCVGTAYVLVFVIPNLQEIRARAELRRAQEITAEDRFYCSKWGMPEGTRLFMPCALDLQKIRAEAERRMSSDDFF
jgi:hypothetical protein